MSQPFTNTPRPETGMTNAKLGTWLFLAAEFMFCSAFASSYVLLRTAADYWPDGKETLSASLMFITLIVMALVWVFMAKAAKTMQYPRAPEARKHLAIVIALGFAAIGLMKFAGLRLWQQGITPSTDTFHALFYVFSGVAILHAFATWVWTLYLAGPGFAQASSDAAAYANRLACTKLVWNFTALLWAVIVFLFCMV
ncbi:MAG: hypothetical protein AMXMBFR84_19720 [Candidatus Hydrogenedentota bacterium]